LRQIKSWKLENFRVKQNQQNRGNWNNFASNKIAETEKILRQTKSLKMEKFCVKQNRGYLNNFASNKIVEIGKILRQTKSRKLDKFSRQNQSQSRETFRKCLFVHTYVRLCRFYTAIPR
jgi:hypothetical protein